MKLQDVMTKDPICCVPGDTERGRASRPHSPLACWVKATTV